MLFRVFACLIQVCRNTSCSMARVSVVDEPSGQLACVLPSSNAETSGLSATQGPYDPRWRPRDHPTVELQSPQDHIPPRGPHREVRFSEEDKRPPLIPSQSIPLAGHSLDASINIGIGGDGMRLTLRYDYVCLLVNNADTASSANTPNASPRKHTEAVSPQSKASARPLPRPPRVQQPVWNDRSMPAGQAHSESPSRYPAGPPQGSNTSHRVNNARNDVAHSPTLSMHANGPRPLQPVQANSDDSDANATVQRGGRNAQSRSVPLVPPRTLPDRTQGDADRKSTRLNSSHSGESRMPSSA